MVFTIKWVQLRYKNLKYKKGKENVNVDCLSRIPYDNDKKSDNTHDLYHEFHKTPAVNSIYNNNNNNNKDNIYNDSEVGKEHLPNKT